MSLDYTVVKSRVIDTYENARRLHVAGQINELHQYLWKQYQSLYNEITNGKFNEVLDKQKKTWVAGGGVEGVTGAWQELEHFRETLGPQFKRIFRALRFLDSWCSDSDPNESWNGRSKEEWAEFAGSVIDKLKNDHDL